MTHPRRFEGAVNGVTVSAAADASTTSPWNGQMERLRL